MKVQVSFVSVLLTVAAMGVGGEFAHAISITNNGNHFGWYKEDGPYIKNTENSDNGSGNHNAWYKENGGSQSSQNSSAPIMLAQLTTPVPQASVPEPASLLLLGSALTGIGMLRRRTRKT